MQTPQPASPPAKSKLPTILIIIAVLLIACALAVCCVVVILAALGPSVGNVFSNIIQNMPTPMP
jgi:flagellar basal body-associated protein FliL